MRSYSYVDNTGVSQVEKLYDLYRKNPESVDKDWSRFFEGFEFAKSFLTSSSGGSEKNSRDLLKVYHLIHAYRSKGHLNADVSPISNKGQKIDLSLESFGLESSSVENFDFGSEVPFKGNPLEIEKRLKQIYEGSIGFEAMHCREDVRQFILVEIEEKGRRVFSPSEKKALFDSVMKAATFENFLHTRYAGKKRFSIEGLDALVALFNHLIEQSDNFDIKDWMFALAHRGRLNALTNVLDKPYEELFTEFEEHEIKDKKGDADVKYHLGRFSKKKTSKGNEITLEMPYNPSHLETVDSIVAGMARAKIDRFHGKDAKKVATIVVHGDASLAGQGVVYEMINMAYVPSASIGGTLHVVANNQIGFTANPDESRSSRYATDLAKVIGAPVFHVNADDVEAIAWVGELSLKIRQKFGSDVFIDVVGYRRYGHNESDEPRFTQPSLYDEVDRHENVRDLYASALINDGVLTQSEVEKKINDFSEMLQKKFEEVSSGKAYYTPYQRSSAWDKIEPAYNEEEMANPKAKTATSKAVLEKIVDVLSKTPSDFDLFKRFERVLKQRKTMFEEDSFDWSMGELVAYGSLLLEGYHVRINGEDAVRGTFSHRQAMVSDSLGEKRYYSLQHLDPKQGDFEIHNSILSEYAAMGFEYGYACISPKTLVVWEGQFGDFANGAQVIIDQYISAAQSKWGLLNGLVLFLPHGQEGQGPEHSSARLERFLQLCAEANMYVCNVTTPANMHHLLKRQVLSNVRKPLVIMTPKSLLRHPLAKSKAAELTSGSFQTIIDDNIKAEGVKKVFLCSGRVYYDFIEEREKLKRKDLAFVRIEQLYPLDKNALNLLKKKYKGADFFWLQEEPENMGAWWYILVNLGKEFKLGNVSRKPSASPAVGKAKKSEKDKKHLLDLVFGESHKAKK